MAEHWGNVAGGEATPAGDVGSALHLPVGETESHQGLQASTELGI